MECAEELSTLFTLEGRWLAAIRQLEVEGRETARIQLCRFRRKWSDPLALLGRPFTTKRKAPK